MQGSGAALAGLLMAVGLLLSPQGPARAEEAGTDAQVERGRVLSEAHCQRCHVISSARRYAGISSTPSFPLLVNAFDDWRERFATFHARRPHPAHVDIDGFPVERLTPPSIAVITLKLEDVEAILAFAETLQEQ